MLNGLIKLPVGKDDYTIFHGKLPDGSYRDVIDISVDNAYHQYDSLQFENWTNSIIKELLERPDGADWLKAYQLFLENNAVALAVGDGPFKVVQPGVSVEDVLKYKRYLEWIIARRTLNSSKFYDENRNIINITLDDFKKGLNPPGEPVMIYLYLYVSNAEINSYLNVFLDPFQSGQETRQKWYYALYMSAITDSYGFLPSNKKIEEFRNECFNWIWPKQMQSVINKTEQKVTGRRGSGNNANNTSSNTNNNGTVTGRGSKANASTSNITKTSQSRLKSFLSDKRKLIFAALVLIVLVLLFLLTKNSLQK